MKTVATVLVSALILGGAAYAGQQKIIRAKDPTARAQIKTLRAQLRKLDQRVRVLELCETTVIGVNRYDNYVATDGTNLFPTTGLDMSDQGETPQQWLSVVDPGCVQTAGFKATGGHHLRAVPRRSP